MLQIRKSNERGVADHGWLNSHHTFSFASYYDPKHMGFHGLRVINEDRILGGTGFGEHPHSNMEIVSYVVKGALEHQDSMGNKTLITPGEVQRMSAGTGVIHSEYNHMKDSETHFFQIWLMPEKQGIKPGYGQKSFEEDLKNKKLVLVVSREGRDGSISINRDTDIYISRLKAGEDVSLSVKENRNVWVQVVKGDLEINGALVSAGDGVAISQEKLVEAKAKSEAELILFDLVD